MISNAKSYKLYRSSSSTGVYNLLGRYIVESCFDNSPLNGNNYYKVSAVNNNNESILSDYWYYNYTGNLPSAPTNVTAIKNGTSINITWSPVISATSYKVYHSSSSRGEYTLLGTYTGTSTVHNSPISGINNWYKIIAVNSAGESPTGGYDFCYYVLSIPATPNPTGNFPIIAINRKLKITWDAVPGATYYKIYRTIDNANNFIYIANPTSNIYWDDNPINGHYHFYKVSAVNSAGESPLSSFSAYFFIV